MTLDEMKFWAMVVFQVINAMASSGLWLYVRYGDRNKEVDNKFETLTREFAEQNNAMRVEFDRRADEHDRRLSRVEGAVERAPTHDDLGQLHEKVNQTAQGVAQMNGQLSSMNDTLRLILNRIAEKGMP